MRRIYTNSDIHLDFNLEEENMEQEVLEFGERISKQLLQLNATDYIINGDVALGKKWREILFKEMEKHLEGKCQIHLVMGNHDIADEYTMEEFMENKMHRYSLANNPIVLEDKVIFGCNGFSDATFMPEEYKEERLAIYKTKHFSEQEIITQEMVDAIITKELEDLQEQFDKEEYKGKDKIVMIHYAPNRKFIQTHLKIEHEKNLSYLGSDRYSKMFEENGVKECYFGHTHFKLSQTLTEEEMTINNVKYRCYPIGKHWEWLRDGEIEEDVDKSLDLLFKKWLETLASVN